MHRPIASVLALVCTGFLWSAPPGAAASRTARPVAIGSASPSSVSFRWVVRMQFPGLAEFWERVVLTPDPNGQPGTGGPSLLESGSVGPQSDIGCKADPNGLCTSR